MSKTTAGASASKPPIHDRDHDHGKGGHAGHGHSHQGSHSHAHGHHHGHGNDHDHGGHGHSHAPEVTSQNERVVLAGFLLTFGFMFAEVVGGLLSGSLALIADAGHMLTDAAALALAWAGFRFGRRIADKKRTFGYMRFEVLAGFINAVSLLLLVGWITYEAVERLIDPAPVLAGPMMIVAVLGLAVNSGVFYMLMRGDRDHVNIKGAMVHVLGDLLGSVAAIVAAIAIWFTGWTPIDPILSVLLSAIVLRSAWALLRSSLHILMEGAPLGFDPDTMRDSLVKAVPGLTDVRHIHVWSITSGRATSTMHVALNETANPAVILGNLKAKLAEEYGITHATIEIDWTGAEVACTMAAAPQAPRHDHHGHDHDAGQAAHGPHGHAHDHDHKGHDHGHDHKHDHDHKHGHVHAAAGPHDHDHDALKSDAPPKANARKGGGGRAG